MDLRLAARQIFHEALHRVDLRSTMRRKLQLNNGQLQIEDAVYDLANLSHVIVIAIGKAAVPMAEGLLELLAPVLGASCLLEGVVIGPTLPPSQDSRLVYRLGSHPLPDESSRDAADIVLRLLKQATSQTHVFFLISGGASAMVERPLDPTITTAEITAFYQALLHSGLSITQMNTLRKHPSAVKGGRLAVAAAAAARQLTLLVSDVPPAHPDVIGSGVSLPDTSTLQDCRRLLCDVATGFSAPAVIQRFFAAPDAPETSKPGAPAFARAGWHTLLSSEDLCRAAQQVAEERGFHVVIDLTCDEWAVDDAAEYLLGTMASLAAEARRPVCLISAGELAVRVPAAHGIGGRNQHFALRCAFHLAELPYRVAVLSAGSDGIDGNSPAAGAVVDPTTTLRASELGFTPARALTSFDSFPLLHALGDTVMTGPTGNNLRDLRLLLMDPPDH